MASQSGPGALDAELASLFPSRFKVWFNAVRDARAECLPHNGSTPMVEVVAAAARTGISTQRCQVQAEAADIAERLRVLAAQLVAAERDVVAATAAVNELPDRPSDVDLPNRPVPAAPVVVASLKRATAARDLNNRRRSAAHALTASIDRRDALTADMSQLEERLRQLPARFIEASLRVTSAGDVHVARYTTVLRRWHRNPGQLAPHLPLPRLADRSDLLLDPTFARPPVHEQETRS